MPYLPSDARKKSEEYNNILSGDVIEYQNTIEDLKKSLNISGSVVDAKAPLRNSEGILQSFEGSIDGLSLEEDFQQVRLENKQQFFTGQLDNSFSFFGAGQDGSTTDSETETTSNQITTEVIEFQATIRDYLIQVINEYFNEENTPDMSTDALHEKILKFFKENRKDKKNVNADGWEAFRINTKRNVRGISGRRLLEIFGDLKNFRYDEIVEDHLYRTLQGQRIWLQLGFPYIIDKKLD
jgi:hypothetical protein|tara:strand:+ start:5596 stop:6312 length:717 start_codon:yes stop_codon:yes gene_type:complete